MVEFTGPEALAQRESVAGATERTVVIVDDHRTFADLMKLALDAEPDLRCVGVAYGIASGLALVEARTPDLVIMDLQFFGDENDGVTATAAITARHPRCQVVLLTGHADPLLMRRVAEAGASSLMPKSGSLPDLLEVLRSAPGEGLTVHPELLKSLVRQPAAAGAHGIRLSRREEEVLSMLVVGLGVPLIAEQLCISLNTCRGYVKSLLRKLDAHSQLEAVAIARRHGLVSTGDAP